MTIKLVTVPFTTDASGDFSTTISNAAGEFLQARYDRGNVATGADITVVGATTGLSLLALVDAGTADITRAPRQPIHDTAGVASLYAAAGEPVEDFIYVGGEQLTVTVAQGGNTTSGTLYLWFRY